jgi:hypothetical protein
VLSTPPAFVLSQDQTLHRNRFDRLSCESQSSDIESRPHSHTRERGQLALGRTLTSVRFKLLPSALMLLYGLKFFSNPKLIRSWLPLFCFQGATSARLCAWHRVEQGDTVPPLSRPVYRFASDSVSGSSVRKRSEARAYVNPIAKDLSRSFFEKYDLACER